MKKIISLCLVLLLQITCYAAVQDVFWTGANPGNWMTQANWTEDTTDGNSWAIPGWVIDNPYNPGSWTSTSNKGFALIQTGTAVISWNADPYIVPDGRIERIYVSGAANPTLQIESDASVYKLWVSSNSGDTGTITQNGGNFTVTYRMYLGDYGTGVYNLNGGVLMVPHECSYIGSHGNGILNINSGGQALLNTGIYMGYDNGVTGTINVNGGTLVHTTQSTDYMTLGYANGGTGILDVNSGNVSIEDCLAGSVAGSTGIINITGGNVSFPGTAHIGEYGYGELNQSASDIAARKIYIGNKTTGEGIWKISGGSLTASAFISVTYNQSAFKVVGTGATKIETDRLVVGTAGVLAVDLGATGSTLIQVIGNKVIDPNGYEGALINGKIQVDTLAGYTGTVGSTFDILSSDTTLDTTGLSVENLDMDHSFTYSVVTVGGKQVLRLTEIEGICGDNSHPHPLGDLSGPDGNQDCRVNFYDIAAIAEHWLECTIDCD